jgi:hypothetical protein
MAHWVGRSVVHESGERMSWDNLISNWPGLVDLWVKLGLEANAIMARFKDGVMVDFADCLIQVHFPPDPSPRIHLALIFKSLSLLFEHTNNHKGGR